MMQKYIEELTHNKNRNNVNGVFSIKNVKIFYKILNDSDYEKELVGYNILKNHYSVPLQYFKFSKNNTNIVGYEYNESVRKNEGLLVDYFSGHERLNSKYQDLLKIYHDVFADTIKYGEKGNCRMFFEDRLNTRLKNNISNKYIKDYNERIVNFNSTAIKIDNDSIYNDILQYFKMERKTWNIISNADPNDMNICIDGTFFDYTAGGYVPLMCEFAVFVYYNLVQGEYLSLKYNQNSFKEHKKIYKKIKKVKKLKNQLNHKPRDIRLNAVYNYIDIVVKPILEKLEYDDWYNDFKNYFAMKVLAVYNFNEMKKKDILLSICYLNLFYNNNFKKIEELKIFIEKIYKEV